MKILLLTLSITVFLHGCKQGEQSMTDLDFEDQECPNELFDSLIWQQYHCPDDEEKTAFEWNWAYDVREAIGVEDLDSLTSLSRDIDSSYHFLATSGIPFQMDTATRAYAGTARFCMLNVYQSLAELVAETPLNDNYSYYIDYALWEGLFKEFDAWYVNAGSSRGYEVNCYYKQLAESRTDYLFEELSYFSGGKSLREQDTDAEPPHWDKQWIKTHPAIRLWYNHRIKMADKIQSTNPSWAQCIRTLTNKQVSHYTKFEKETEEYYRFDDE